MRPVFGHVCQRLMVESYCTPGSAQPHAASATWRQRSFALVGLADLAGRAKARLPLAAREAARMNSSVTRTLLFEFCPLIVW